MTGMILIVISFLLYIITVYLDSQYLKDKGEKNIILHSILPLKKIQFRTELLYASNKWLAIIWFFLGLLSLYLEKKGLLGSNMSLLFEPIIVVLLSLLLWMMIIKLLIKRYPFG